MYYRIYQDSTQIYPAWGYNLTHPSLKKMAQWYLKSLFYQWIYIIQLSEMVLYL